EYKDFDTPVQTPRPRRCAEPRGHASDDHELHRRLLLLPHLLYETEYVEGFDLTIGKVAVNSVLLVVENLEHGGKLGHDQQFDVAPVEVQQLYVAAVLAHGRGDHHQRTQARAIDVIHARQVENQVAPPGGVQAVHRGAQRGRLFAHCDPPV